jgi:hypothetical protein
MPCAQVSVLGSATFVFSKQHLPIHIRIIKCATILGNNVYNCRTIYLCKTLNIRIVCGARHGNSCRRILRDWRFPSAM